jgi:hypothetical protein
MPLCQRVDQNDGQQQTPQWESRWGAIVTDGSKAVLGVAHGKMSKPDAETFAMIDCRSKGGTQCKLQVSYANSCGVLVVGDQGFNASNAPTLDEAIQSSMKVCRADGDTGCHVYYSDCSPAERVR